MRKLNVKLVTMLLILGPFAVFAGTDNNNPKEVSKVEVSEVAPLEEVSEGHEKQLEQEIQKVEHEAANLATPCLILPDCLGF